VDAVQAQASQLAAPATLRSARVLDGIAGHGNSFYRYALAQSAAHAENFLSRPLDPALRQQMMQEAALSIAQQKQIESQDQGSFDDFVEAYRAATPQQLGA
jgi:glutamate--cysteine ligase